MYFLKVRAGVSLSLTLSLKGEGTGSVPVEILASAGTENALSIQGEGGEEGNTWRRISPVRAHGLCSGYDCS